MQAGVPGGRANAHGDPQNLRDRFERATLLGKQVFEVWINEDAPAAGLEVPDVQIPDIDVNLPPAEQPAEQPAEPPANSS